MSQNHYSILGVSASAPAADIKRAYRRLAVQFHPDKHGGNPRFEEQFKAVALAYGVLSNPGRRAQYDFQLAQTARRLADEQRRAASPARQARPNAYGMPATTAGPLRTRPPAGARERHYRTIPRQQLRFTRRDWGLVLAIVLAMCLFGWAVKKTMYHVTTPNYYADGLRAYGQGRWATAYAAFETALHFRPDYAPALRRRAELDELIDHNFAAAAAGYQAFLAQPQPPAVAAAVYQRLAGCQAELGNYQQAENTYTHALALDSTLTAAWLARGTVRLLGLQPSRPEAALADLRRGLALRTRRGQAPAWPAVQLRGLALARLGRSTEARAAYEQVLAARPTDGRTHFLLGCLARQAGDPATACSWYRRAVALGYAYAREAAAGCR